MSAHGDAVAIAAALIDCAHGIAGRVREVDNPAEWLAGELRAVSGACNAWADAITTPARYRVPDPDPVPESDEPDDDAGEGERLPVTCDCGACIAASCVKAAPAVLACSTEEALTGLVRDGCEAARHVLHARRR